MTKISTKVKAYIEHGMYAACKGKDGRWKVFTHIDGVGNCGGTYRRDTVQGCLDAGLDEPAYPPEEIDRYFTHVEPLPRPIKYFKEGDLVDILESARDIPEFDEWEDGAKKMVGQKRLEVGGANSASYVVHTKDKSDWFLFPHHVLSPHFPEDASTDDTSMSDEELLAELEKRGLLEDKKVIK